MKVLVINPNTSEEFYRKLNQAAKETLFFRRRWRSFPRPQDSDRSRESGFDKVLEKKLGVPVPDGSVCALKLLELFDQYGFRPSKALTYAAPLSKELTGLSSQLSNVFLNKK